MRLLIPLLLLGLAAAGAAAADPAGVRVRMPVADSIVSGSGRVHVIVELDGEAAPSAVRARLKGADLGPGTYRARAGGGGVSHWSVQLTPGPNVLEVEFAPAGRPATREARAVYFFDPVHAASEPPKTFKRAPFHQAGAEAVCRECHRTQSVPDDVAPAAPDQSTCFTCHAGLTKVKEVHGPAALWACTKCHDATSTPGRYATPEPVMPLCFSCHQEQKDRFYGSPYQHGPTATGFCTLCHNPHGSEHGLFLKKAAWNLCTTCHFEKGSGRHVVSWGPSGQTHPTRGRPDPSRPNRELSCASCHNPHAAAGPKLWNFGATIWLDLCRNCHGRIFGG